MSKKRKLGDGSTKDVQLYCLCRQKNDENEMMVECDFCDGWFHPRCVDMDEDEAGYLSSWNCPGCIEIMNENPTLTRKALLAFQGRIAPKNGWGQDFYVTDIDEKVLDEKVKTKRHRIEGYNLFREGKVSKLSCVKSESGKYIYFKGVAVPSMKDKDYHVHLCLKNGGTSMKWATCTCPAGNDGQCKHVVAIVYLIIDLHRQGVEKIPDIQTCTDKLQMWHVRKPISDEPLLFSDINFVKHDPFKVAKRELCSTVKYHNPVPHFAKAVSSTQIEKLVKLYDTGGLKLPVIETLRSNNCEPVLPKAQSDASDLNDMLFERLQETTSTFSKTCHEFSENEKTFYEGLITCDIKMSKNIEKQTRMQSKNAKWFSEREYRITSSTFGTFCRMKSTTDPCKTFDQKKVHFTSRSVKHGIMYENVAFAKYAQQTNVTDSAVGLVVNPNIPFLGASPDRIVLTEDRVMKLVEVKCPYSLFDRKTSIQKQINNRSFYLKKDNDRVKLHEKHDYYFQIQGQLNICGIETCDLVVFVPPDDIMIVCVERDQHFFNSVMLPKLSDIWFNKLLPHFVS
ncbi:uncharacterized protein LOC127880788 [Dreissena polymorpha]|uniref:uncharacterized protein LOC127847776 n=1 Tax=Dreissena polymorpha TaxID=45954 RepID=UPI0022650302|nr:uncharacterized protein LOC127847776 [Dreissena polymorpha]XP_052235873.1 uncharacterized protein LOC127847776 [Dreissena polymorpha]XP_052284161.1 uncharacterized protein LOC127880788 [Dreissena polymorpha]XP_052284163.1 uncharacterized protein LOC127880788 [Dreissena polymorpha]